MSDWWRARQLRADLDTMKLDDRILRQIRFTDAQPSLGPRIRRYPPTPGCCDPPGIGSARLWGEFTLAEWFTAAPGVLESTTLDEAKTLDAIAARLRLAGEGTRTLWALDLVARTTFYISDLVCFGPMLAADLIADVDALFAGPTLAAFGWGRLPPLPGPMCRPGSSNTPSAHNGVACYETTWTSEWNYPVRSPTNHSVTQHNAHHESSGKDNCHVH